MKLVVANHKMKLLKPQLLSYLVKLREMARRDLDIVICPNMLYLSAVEAKNYKLGSQNVAYSEDMSLTGEVSAAQLRNIGVTHCIVGHSERRISLAETNNMINNKIKCLLKNGITPILCIGETKEQRNMRRTDLILEKELKECLRDLSEEEIISIVIAYEPIWAIGTGLIPNNQEIERTSDVIREILNRYFGAEPKIIYGGSINEKNIQELEKIKNIDGYLVGGASLDINTWLTLLNRME